MYDMVQLVIQNLFHQTIAVETNHTILRNLQLHAVDWLQACGGKGRCTTCAMLVIEGETALTPPTAFEQKEYLTGRLRPQERLACQCKTNDSIIVAVPDRYKLPHLQYGDSKL